MEKPKVLFIIYSINQSAVGGHFHSLISLTDSLSEDINYIIINLGKAFSPILKEKKEAFFIQACKRTFFNTCLKLTKIIKETNPTSIHAFDRISLIYANQATFFKNRTLIFTKCGGPNEKTIPYSDISIFFSKENLNYFSTKNLFNTEIYFLPNRVNGIIEQDKNRIEQLKREYQLNGKTIFIRIARFSELHKISIIQTINLFKLYHEKINKNSKLLLIGVNQSADVTNQICQKIENLPAFIITSDNYTQNASSLLGVADFIVATGRGVMEAAGLSNKKLFVPIETSPYPIPITSENFDKLFHYNFSPRIKGVEIDFDKIYTELKDKTTTIEFINKIFSEYFDINTIKDTYLTIYNRKAHKPRRKFLLAIYQIKMVLNYFGIG
ncbi:hypothetical protein ADIS_3641 [Lunatimonas lonarensis]|uniref:Glycosyl transferase family 28 C-terminal domain-containing protein n=1 Tax=Lunatimonas lonarensis TaxID=1232681 RepID=R7ZPD3_9BACT|nr:hypothetical protein [Lunatimonas lonarensis]EON75884.1 hypothetical protein ADIS_3641 [Lunatimonas lonarensis]